MTGIDVAREHRDLADWDAAYVLGALTPADRRRYEHHLDACERCRAAVTPLSGLPGLLAGVPLDQVSQDQVTAGVGALDDDVPADLLPRLSRAVSRRRSRRLRYGLLTGLAAAAVAVLAVVLLWPSSPPAGSGTVGARTVTVALEPVVANPLAVDVTLAAEPWGTRIDLKCRFAGDGGAPGPNRDYGYALFVTNRAGTTMAGPTWTYGPDTEAEPVGTSKWPVDQITAIEVRADDGTVLLRGTP